MNVKRPATLAFVFSVFLITLAFIRMEMIAQNATADACEAFQDSKDVLKNVLILAVPTEVPTPDGATAEEIKELSIEQQRRVAFRNSLIEEIDRAEC